MRFYLNILIVLCLGIALTACEQAEGDELTIQELQKDEIKELNKFKLRASLNAFSFNTNEVYFFDLDSVFQIHARLGSERLNLYIPYLGAGTFYGANDSKVTISYLDAKNRNFNSKNFKFSSDVRITISELDTVLNRLSGSFMGTLYNPETLNPQNRIEQVIVQSGQLLNINY